MSFHGFNERTEVSFIKWYKERLEKAGHDANSPDVDHFLKELSKGEFLPEQQDLDMEETKKECTGLEEYLNRSLQPPDPRLSSTEKTWDLYIASLNDGDRETAMLCLSGGRNSKWGKIISDMNETELAVLAKRIEGFRLSHFIGEDTAVGYATNIDQRTGEIWFHKDRDEWLISSM